MQNRIFIDMNNYLKRIYHGGGDPYSLWLALLNNHRTREVIIACDSATSREYRKKIFKDYKKGRKQDDDPIYWELYNNAITIARHFPNVSVFEIITGEADDYIGCNAKANDIVISNDKDLWPLVSRNVTILINATTKVDRQLIATKFIHDDPKLIVLYKSLVGDPSDNIKGKFRFGVKAYEKLAKSRLYTILDNLITESYKDELIDENVKTSFKLASFFQSSSAHLYEPLEYSSLNNFITSKGIVC